MTVITPKLGQKRLDSCDLARPKWAGFHEKRGKCGCDAFKIDEIALDDTVRVENAHQNGQTRPNNTLLGKYRLDIGGMTAVFFSLMARRHDRAGA